MAAGAGGVRAFESRAEPEMLVGEISPQDLREVPYAEWYIAHRQAYQVDAESISDLPELFKDVAVTIIMGTWCHDSQRQVPRFYKILSTAGVNMSRVDLFAVDMNFTTPADEAAGLGITNTPTFIFYRDGKELNRIVETPVISLEKDVLTILRGEAYRHSKLAAN